MKLLLVRHPKPSGAAGLCYGRTDLECDPNALEDAALRVQKFAGGQIIVSSPARRALALATRLTAGPIVEPRLQELDFGEWEGRLWQDLGRAAIDAWRAGLPDSVPPGGESLTQMAARCADWLEGLRSCAAPVLAVTHAGPIRIIRALLAGEPLLTYFDAPVPFAEPLAIEACRNGSGAAFPANRGGQVP